MSSEKSFLIAFCEHRITMCADDVVEAATRAVEQVYRENNEITFPSAFVGIESQFVGTPDEPKHIVLLNGPLILSNAGLYNIATELQKKITQQSKNKTKTKDKDKETN